MKILLILVLGFILEAQAPLKTLKFKSGAQLQVEVVDSFETRAQGLKGRTSLPANQGMLFKFETPQKLSFWMKNTYVPLSIGYFDENKTLKEIYHMAAQNMMERSENLQSYPSQCECLYALEVNQGWFKKNNVKVGDSIQLE